MSMQLTPLAHDETDHAGMAGATPAPPLRLARGLWGSVGSDAGLPQLARSALEAARFVLGADFCAFAWEPEAGPPMTAASQGIGEDRLQASAPAWLSAVGLGPPGLTPPASTPEMRIEPVPDGAGRVRGVLVAALRATLAHSPDARVLMPVFATHLGLLAEHSGEQAQLTASYEALVRIGMQIQAAESDSGRALSSIVELARELMRTDLAWLGLVDDAGETLRMAVAAGARTAPFMHMSLRLGEGIGGVAVAARRPVVLPDYRRDGPEAPAGIRTALLDEGVVSMLCAPMLHGDRAIGALYVGSRRPVDFGATAVALTCALAAQAAVAVENGRLYRRLESKNAVLEDVFGVHRSLTDAALSGHGPHDISRELAELLGLELELVQDVVPPFRLRVGPLVEAARRAAHEPPDEQAHRVFAIVGDADLGELRVLGPDSPLTALQEKGLEHGATVLALELLKQRASQDVAWQLHGDLLNELLEAPAPYRPGLLSRARRHGIDLERPHRVVAIAPAGSDPLTPSGDALLALVRRVTGRHLHHRCAALVGLRSDHVVLLAGDGESGDTCSALVRSIAAAAEEAGGRLAIGVGEPHVAIGLGHRQATACSRLARGDGASTRVLEADSLGALRFILDAPDLTHVRELVRRQLGRLTRRQDAGGTELLATLEAFVAADGNVAVSAERCFVHKNTLRYRVQRAGTLLGRDPFDPDVKFELRIAFGLLDLFAGLGIDLLSERVT